MIGKVDRDRLNQLGGSIAIGHPFAATAIRIVSQIANEMAGNGARYGLASVCEAAATAAAVNPEYAFAAKRERRVRLLWEA